jgi:choline dehydrogenase
MPRITTGKTTAPCVVIGERAADILRRRNTLDVNDMNVEEQLG